MKIRLDETTHQYFVDAEDGFGEQKKRSWSAISHDAGLAEDLSMVPPHHLANARARGSQIDDAAALIIEGHFASIHDEILSDEARPYVEAFREFWMNDAARLREPQLVQTPLYCRELDFCCTPDWHDGFWVNDLKATSKCSRTWGLQTAAQLLAHGFMLGERRIVWLRPKLRRQYEIHIGSDSNRAIFSPMDFDVVKAACQGDYAADCIKRWKDGG